MPFAFTSRQLQFLIPLKYKKWQTPWPLIITDTLPTLIPALASLVCCLEVFYIPDLCFAWKALKVQNELLLMIKPLNSLLPYNLAEKIRPKGQEAQSSPPCRNLAQVGKERTFSGPLFHAHLCPRRKEGWGVMENKGWRACGTLITPWQVPGSAIGTQLVPVESLTTCRKDMQGGSRPIGEYHNLKSGIFSDFCS